MEQCLPNSCANGGICEDLWTSYGCKCLRPFLPLDCVHKIVEATFGHSNQSTFIEYALDSKTSVMLREITELSFLLQTNVKSAQILYLGEAENSSEFDELATTFMSVEMDQGFLRINLRLGGKNVRSKRSVIKINNNKAHLIEIFRHQDQTFVSNILFLCKF